MEQWQRNNTLDASPGLTWPILFGENHLHSAQALVDDATTSIHFRHPGTSFKTTCSLENPQPKETHIGSNTHTGFTCLLSFDFPPGPSSQSSHASKI